MKKNIISVLVMLVLSILTFFILFREISLGEIVAALKGAKPEYLVLGVLAMLVFIAAEAAIIYIAMKTMNQKIKFKRCMEYSFIGFYFSSITPSSTGGQPAQVYYMNKDKISIPHASLILLIITSVYQMTMLLYGVVLYFCKYNVLAQGMNVMKWLFLFGVLANGISAVFIFAAVVNQKLVRCILSFFIKLLYRVHMIKNKEHWMERIDKQMVEYIEGARYLKGKPGFLIKTIGFTILQMTAMYMVPFFVYHALGLNGSPFLDIIAVQAVLSLAVSSVPLPGAVGASESGFMILYKLLFGAALLAPAMLLSRMISFYLFLVASGVVSLYVQIRQNKVPCVYME